VALGRDEKVFIHRDVMGPLVDPSFTRVRDPVLLDMILQIPVPIVVNTSTTVGPDEAVVEDSMCMENPEPHYQGAAISSSSGSSGMAEYKTMFNSLLQHVTSALKDPVTTLLPQPQALPSYRLQMVEAVTPTGLGAASIPDVAEVNEPSTPEAREPLTWTKIFFAGESCDSKLPDEVVRSFHVIVMRRGGCTFSEKLANIPAFTPSAKGLQLVVIVSDVSKDLGEGSDQDKGGGFKPIRPLLDEVQQTPAGLPRHHLVPMVLVEGGEQTENFLKQAKSFGLRRRYHVESQGLVINNLVVV